MSRHSARHPARHPARHSARHVLAACRPLNDGGALVHSLEGGRVRIPAAQSRHRQARRDLGPCAFWKLAPHCRPRLNPETKR